ncbi:MAG: hypothetical protein IKH78_10835 [Ruminococcus sp.]|nr:hypothetical protein [Ruminococcus sp.]
MKNKVLKKAFAAALASTLIGGELPAAIGGVSVLKPALTAEAATEYDLEICGTQVTSSNKNDIYGNGIFVFDEASKTLTITDSYDATAPDEYPMIYTDMDDLTIFAHNEEHSITLRSNTVVLSIYGNGSVTVTGDSYFEIFKEDLDTDRFTEEGAVYLRDEATLRFKDFIDDPIYIGKVTFSQEARKPNNSNFIVDNSRGTIVSFDLDLNLETPFLFSEHFSLVDCYIKQTNNCAINDEGKQVVSDSVLKWGFDPEYFR